MEFAFLLLCFTICISPMHRVLTAPWVESHLTGKNNEKRHPFPIQGGGGGIMEPPSQNEGSHLNE